MALQLPLQSVAALAADHVVTKRTAAFRTGQPANGARVDARARNFCVRRANPAGRRTGCGLPVRDRGSTVRIRFHNEHQGQCKCQE